MKILMVLESEFPPDTRVENEISALVEAGHQIEIACLTKSGHPLCEKNNGYTIHRKMISEFMHKTSVGTLKFPFYFNFWRKFLKQLLKDNSFDAIHIHDLPLSKVGYEMKRAFNLKLTIDLHENWPGLLKISTHTQSFLGKLLSSNSQWKRYEKSILKKADNIIVVIEESKERIQKLGIKAEKISIVSNTLNTEEFKEHSSKPDPNFFTLYYAGGVTKHRGLQTVIRSLKLSRNEIPSIRLWIVGKGRYLGNLKAISKEEHVEDIVNFLGWKPLDEVANLLSQSDVALIPHLKSEHTDSTIPHKLFQYMYLRKPILSTDCIPLKRIIEQNESGLIYKNNNIEDLSAKTISLYKNTRQLNLEKGKKAVEEKYNWEVDKKRLIEIYS